MRVLVGTALSIATPSIVWECASDLVQIIAQIELCRIEAVEDARSILASHQSGIGYASLPEVRLKTLNKIVREGPGLRGKLLALAYNIKKEVVYGHPWLHLLWSLKFSAKLFLQHIRILAKAGRDRDIETTLRVHFPPLPLPESQPSPSDAPLEHLIRTFSQSEQEIYDNGRESCRKLWSKIQKWRQGGVKERANPDKVDYDGLFETAFPSQLGSVECLLQAKKLEKVVTSTKSLR